MLIEVLKSKIHRVTVTDCDLNYIGSITIDEALIEAANMIVGEKVQYLTRPHQLALSLFGSTVN